MDVEDYYNEKAPFYDGEYKTPFFDLYRAITWENMKKFLPDKGVILDAGGGTGEWAIKLAEKGYSVVMADISRGMLRQARLKLEEKGIKNVVVQHLDIKDMSFFQDETFDMVLAQGDVLSYCGDAEKAVKELYRVVKTGCYCIASVDSMHSCVVNLIKMEYWDVLDTLLQKSEATPHGGFTIHYFTPRSLGTLFEDAGFEVIRIVGKPVFLSNIPPETAYNLLRDTKIFEKVLGLELQYCDDLNIVGFAGHLEIVGRK